MMATAFGPTASWAGPKEIEWNKKLIAAYKREPLKRNPSDPKWGTPPEIQKGIDEFRAQGFPAYDTLIEMAGHKEPREMIVQEYLRKQEDWGLPWLAGRWAYQHSEYDAITTGSVMNQSISSHDGSPLPDDRLLTAYLFAGTIFHNADSGPVNTVRILAHALAKVEPAFLSTRYEIHQQPSLLTIEQTKRFISEQKAKGARAEVIQAAQEILEQLEALFGGGSADRYVARFQLDAATKAAFAAYKVQAGFLAGKVKASDLNSRADEINSALTALADAAMKASSQARTVRAQGCVIDYVVDCSIEQMDLLRQLQTAIFSLANSYLGRLQESQGTLSLGDLRVITESLTKAAISIGFLKPETLRVFTWGEKPKSGDLVGVEEALALIEKLEAATQDGVKNLRQMYNPILARYKEYVPQADRFIDDTVRGTILIPLTNLLAQMHTVLQNHSGSRIILNGVEIGAAYRMLNPGIARGTLVIPTAEQTQDENYNWHPDRIYVLTKTPASLSKVAGLLTTDSGSTISHVQLLASNHGIPNVVITPSLVARLEPMAGQDVLLISLPNGQVEIKAFANATADEIKVWKSYNQVREEKRMRLPVPAGLYEYRAPLRIEQLRMADRGIVAGGKACGQGELAHVFPNHVPYGIVLPFGVYYEHMRESGVQAQIEAMFKSFDANDRSDDAMAKKSAALDRIRELIKTKVQLKPEIIKTLANFLLKAPYSGHGVFVRSDTNAEDLPQFVGAGLNETIPNVVGLENVIKAILQVWASPFTKKALTWRQDLIENPWDVYPSVVIQIGINGTKAGVMVVGSTTTEDFDDEVIIAANEGVGITVVNGEYNPEEVIVSRKAGTVNRVRKAYAPTRKVLLPEGGFAEQPVQGLDPIIPDEHAKQLASVGDQIQRHLTRSYPNAKNLKWDMEWAMVEDKLALLQIRPFIGNKIAANVAGLRVLEKPIVKAKVVKFPLNSREFNLERAAQP